MQSVGAVAEPSGEAAVRNSVPVGTEAQEAGKDKVSFIRPAHILKVILRNGGQMLIDLSGYIQE